MRVLGRASTPIFPPGCRQPSPRPHTIALNDPTSKGDDMAQERQERQRYALQTIFSLFLGLMVAALVGVGVNTFYQPPAEKYQDQMEELDRRQEDIDVKRGPNNELTSAEQAELTEVRDEQRELEDKQQAEMEVWARNTSIVVILFATIAMALSLIRSEQLKVISNGLLLGGLFTMIYGVGYTIFSGDSTARFFVMLFALAMTIGLGYLKFVGGRRAAPQPPASAERSAPAPETGPVSELEARVAALEVRAAAAAAALGGEQER